jgi:hypothetical protein
VPPAAPNGEGADAGEDADAEAVPSGDDAQS